MKINPKKTAGLIVLLAVIAGLFLVLRSPQVSNTLKKLVSTEFESATGYQLIADKLYVNLFPFYAGADNVRIFDDKGERIFEARNVKAYVGLPALLEKTILVNRVVLDSPRANLDARHIRHFARLAKEAKPRKGGFRVKVKSAVIRSGDVSYSDPEKGMSIKAEGLEGDAIMALRQEVRLSAKRIALSARNFPQVTARLNTARVFLKGRDIEVNRISMDVEGSKLDAHGVYSPGKGFFSFGTEINLLAETLKRIFNLKNSGQGSIAIKGGIKLADASRLQDTLVDLKIKGDFYIQTLLELVRANEPNIKGRLKISGSIKGPVSNLTGSGSGTLEKADIYGLQLDSLKYRAKFRNGLLAFSDVTGGLYGGRLKGDFSIALPRVTSFSINAGFSGMDSNRFMTTFLKVKLPIPPGRLSGSLFTSGKTFAPLGHFTIAGTVPGPGFIGRIKRIDSDYNYFDEMLKLSGLSVSTEQTRVSADGMVNLKGGMLDMDFAADTKNFLDLTLPGFSDIEGSGVFTGKISGPLKDPLIDGRLSASNAVYKKIKIGTADADVSYRMDLLQIKRMDARLGSEKFSLKGSISLPGAKDLFEFKNPVYALEVSMKKARMENVINFLKPGLPVSGAMSSDIRITGAAPVITGTVKGEGLSYSGYPVSSADFGFRYENGNVDVLNGTVRKGGSVIKASGSLSANGQLRFNASSQGVSLAGVLPENIKARLPLDYRISFTASGQGPLKDPEIHAQGKFSNGVYRKQGLQGGDFTMGLKGKKLSVAAAIQGGKLALRASALLTEDLPWQANLDIGNSRYDYLLAGFMKNVPEDLLLTMEGKASFSGTRNSVSGTVVLDQMNLSAYGQHFYADSNIVLNVNNKTLTLGNFSLAGGQTSLKVSGSAVMGRSFDVEVEGKTSLALLKGFWSDIEYITGSADYVVHVGGAWDKPRLSGGLSVRNASLGVKGMPRSLRVTQAYLYVDEDRLVIEDFSGKFGGGDVGLTGVVYLEGFRPSRFYFDALLNNVPYDAEGFSSLLSGNVIAKGGTKKQFITGDLLLKRAVYNKKIDWKSWIFKKKAAPPPAMRKGLFSNTELNLSVHGSDNIKVDNNLARAFFTVDLNIRGPLANPVPLGRIEATSGNVYFRNTEFTIERASVIFSDPNRINPALDIAATTVVQGYKISINIAGTLDKFNLTMASEPALDEMDIVSLLTVGQLGQATKGFEGGIGAGEATSFLTGKVQEVISERLRNLTGFDRFQIEPSISKDTGAVTPRLIVSKRLLSEKLYVIYSAPIGSDEQQIVKIEYAVTPHMSLVGVRDERGSMGGDVSFRFEFR
ncbi:MAG: translocation/assembly module TamB domain-containing protein [Nitrospiraceae bacterium]|nr:translocation/assembly module TamB domain-containing protein [Nitrospiraceae bacterium]